MTEPRRVAVPRGVPADVEVWWVDETSRDALRGVLAEATGRLPGDVSLERDEYGKPRLSGGAPLHFNLSHSGPETLIAISRQRPVGVDIEIIHDVAELEALSADHLTEGEKRAWSHHAAEDRDQAFLTCWTRKEACLKALGLGLLVPPGLVDVGCGDDYRTVRVEAGGKEHWVDVWSLGLPGHRAAALALVTREPANRQFSIQG